MTYDQIEQGSDEWFAARLGKVTASRIADMMATIRSGAPAASRANYEAELIAERLTGQRAEGYTNAAMQHGVETEPEARADYEFCTNQIVQEVGFIPHPVIEMAGASPDGLVGDNGLIEIKCPNTAKHLDTLLTGKVEGKYIKQMQFQMACTGREWCDFVSYDPRLPVELNMKIIRVERDDALIAEIEREAVRFLSELDAKIEALNNLNAEK